MERIFQLLIPSRKDDIMKYNCTIIDIDDDEITIKIGKANITGFCNNGTLKQKGDTAEVEISLYDDLEISQCDSRDKDIERKGNSFSYSLYGILDVDKAILNSVIDIAIDSEELFDYGYLDGQRVKIDTMRIDLDFT